jgi:hypothetical protein
MVPVHRPIIGIAFYRQYIQQLIHSTCTVSYQGSIAFFTASSPHSAIKCLLFQSPIFFSFLKIIQYLLTSSSSSPLHLYSSFNDLF